MKTLIIAEKPSVASDLARVLGKCNKQGDYYENDEYLICSAIGHLVELFMPEDIDKKLKYWTLQALPIIPKKFQLKTIEKTKKRFQEIKKLMERKEVSLLINACDAGREGELIFTYIYELAKCKKPYKRLWMTSMTREGILKAFQQLRLGEDMIPLQQAARSRSEADWLIGINGTRAITKRMIGARTGNVASVGRVQTPTLAMVIEKEKEIRNFKSRPFWRITAQFDIHTGSYEGNYQKPNFKKSTEEHDRIDRLWIKEEAEKILTEVRLHSHAKIKEEKKRTTQAAPRLYDLTSLQREANNRFSFPAGKTLKIAQALYEKHKLITYPRTDAKALPEDYAPTCTETLQSLASPYAAYAQPILKNNWVKPDNKRIFNNRQISDHFAIIPTAQKNRKLAEDEQKIYDMIVRRFLAIFYPSAAFDVTTRISTAGDHSFKSEGKVLVIPGWLLVYDKQETDKNHLPAITKEDGTPPQAKIAKTTLDENATKPPPRYTEATLLAAMEGAGKLLEEELAEAMKEKGLGTPATRAQIIDQLIAHKYIERQQRDLFPTAKAETLVDFLKAVNVEELTSPAMTGEWEYKLHEVEQGRLPRKEFMNGIIKMTEKVTEQAKTFDENKTNMVVCDILSPTDGKFLMESFRSYRSQSEDFVIFKTIGNRKMEKEEIRQLIEKREIGPLDGFRSKMGKPYRAILRLDETNKVRFVFENNEGGPSNKAEEYDDLSGFPIMGPCPNAKNNDKCRDGQVHATPKHYLCANATGENARCNFRLSQTLLQHKLTEAECIQLLTEGKTGLIKDFVSRRTKRSFQAHLILKENGEIGFEFAPKKKS